MHDKSTELFANAPIPKAVFMNIIPTIISTIMILIYNLADTFFIGQTHDPLMVAAISVASPAFFFFMMIGNLFGVGGTSLISRTLGAGNSEKAKNISSFCFWTEVVIGVIAIICLQLFATPICYAIGASEDTIGFASEYLRIISFSVPMLIFCNTFSNIIRAEGKPKTAMAGTVMGNIVNIVLDPILISVCGLNVAGAAYATVAGNLIAAAFYLYHFCSKHSSLSIDIRKFSVRDGIVGGVLAIGIPAAMNSLLMSISTICLNSLMSNYGDLAVAGLGVASKVNSITVMVLLGLGIGIQPLLGYNFGARNKKRYLGILKFSCLVAFILSIIMTIICYSLAGPLVSAFLNDPEAFSYGFQFCRIYIYAGPVLGFMFVFTNAIQSTGAAVPALILSVARQGLVLIPLVFLFNTLFHSARAMTYAVPVADYTSTALSVFLFIYAFRKYFKEPEEDITES